MGYCEKRNSTRCRPWTRFVFVEQGGVATFHPKGDKVSRVIACPAKRTADPIIAVDSVNVVPLGGNNVVKKGSL